MSNETKIEEPLMIVRIDISHIRYQGVVEEVVYYNYKLPMRLALKYDWYFEYLAALLKVRHPRRRVNLYVGRQGKILCGKDYVTAKTHTLIKGKRGSIARLKNRAVADDLFNSARAERDEKIAQIQAEIDTLERGEFNYYTPPTYINKIKKWLK